MTGSIINLTRGVPPLEAFPTKDLIECGNAAMQRDADVLLQYGLSPGYAPLREWIGAQYDVGPEQVFVGNGSLEVFGFLTQRLCSSDVRAFVESPSYDRAIKLLRRTGAELVGVPLEQDGVNLSALEKELKKGAPALMYVIVDFQNPRGCSTSLEKRKQLAALAEEYDFWLVEDAPYRQLRYWGEDIPSLLSLAPERVLHMSSFSKTLAPGLRLGYVVGPADVIAALAQWAIDSYIGPVAPSQGMVYEYCRRGLFTPNLERLKQLYRPRLETMLSALGRHIPQVEWTRPDGGFFVSGNLPQGYDVANLLEQAGGVGLKLADGRSFFPNPADGSRFLRIPFCSLTPAEIEQGVKRLASLL